MKKMRKTDLAGKRRLGRIRQCAAGIGAVCLLLSGCADTEREGSAGGSRNEAGGSAGSSGNESGTGSGSSGDTSSGVQDGYGLIELKHRNYRNFYCSNENGYYYLTAMPEQAAEDLWGYYLMYVDYATKQEIFLCSDSACKHNTLDCPAFFSMDEIGDDSCIFLYQGKLYLLSREYDQEGGAQMSWTSPEYQDVFDLEIESNPMALYQMEIDGTKRRKVYEFAPGECVEASVFGSSEGLVFLTKKIEAQKLELDSTVTVYSASDKAAICLDTNDWSRKELLSYDTEEKNGYDIIGAWGNELIGSYLDYGKPVTHDDLAGGLTEEEKDAYSELWENADLVVEALSLTDGSCREIFRKKNGISSCAAAGGKLYSCDGKTVTVSDVQSGEVLQSIETELSDGYLHNILGDILFLSTSSGNDSRVYYLIDLESGKKGYCTLENLSLGWPLEFLAADNNDFLVVYDYEATPEGDGAYEISAYQYGLLSKEDLLDNNPNYRKISMVSGGN